MVTYTIEIKILGQKMTLDLLECQMHMLLGMMKRRYEYMSTSSSVINSGKVTGNGCAGLVVDCAGRPFAYGNFTIPYNSIFYSHCQTHKRFEPSDVVNVEFYPPAVKMFFRDGTITVATPHGDDKYDPEMGMIICILKYIWGDRQYNNFFRKWIKKDKALQEAKEALITAEQDEKERIKKKAAKNAERKRKHAEAKKEREIEIMAEAIRRANSLSVEVENDEVANEDA